MLVFVHAALLMSSLYVSKLTRADQSGRFAESVWKA
jgi:hypothetical protein